MAEITRFYRFKKNVGHFFYAVRFYIVAIIALAILGILLAFMPEKAEMPENVVCAEVIDTCSIDMPVDPWHLCASDVEATVYNAVAQQCNKDYRHTASMFKLDLANVEAHKIIAMERTFMKKLGLVYGDVVKLSGVGKYDGVYQIQDTMNKRFTGQHKIDILVDKTVKRGKWNDVKIYILKDKSMTSNFTKEFKASYKK